MTTGGNSDSFGAPTPQVWEYTIHMDIWKWDSIYFVQGSYIENTVIVQYDPLLQEVWDQARKIRCTWWPTLIIITILILINPHIMNEQSNATGTRPILPSWYACTQLWWREMQENFDLSVKAKNEGESALIDPRNFLAQGSREWSSAAAKIARMIGRRQPCVCESGNLTSSCNLKEPLHRTWRRHISLHNSHCQTVSRICKNKESWFFFRSCQSNNHCKSTSIH